jgi:hypothetical protein
MDRYESPHYKTANARKNHVLDTIVVGGPLTAHVLAAEERQREALRQAEIWAATHQDRERTPSAWRRWCGTLLVRVGNRLQGVTTPAAVELTQVTNS